MRSYLTIHIHALVIILFLNYTSVDLWGQGMIEVCHNEIDDDRDGFIDCFDPDCYCESICDHFYLQACPVKCGEKHNIEPRFELKAEWISQGIWHPYNLGITGDVDNDGIPEVIGKKGPEVTNNNTTLFETIVVLNGQNGEVKYEIDFPGVLWTFSSVAIGDLDRNGLVEIITTTSSISTGGGRIYNFEYNNNGNFDLKWISDVPAIDRNYLDRDAHSPHLADFNGDGLSEVYVINKIYNGANGELILDSGDSKFIGRAYNSQYFNQFTLAADVLQDSQCPDCEGLELLAGGRVYSVHIDTMNLSESRLTHVLSAPKAVDGFNAVADVDFDGDIDVILTHGNSSQAEIIIWDGQTSQLLAPIYYLNSTRGYIGIPAIDDVDNNGHMDIAICGSESFNLFELQNDVLFQKWSIPTTDFSGHTGCIIFDFNGEGRKEVVYRDQTHLRIFDGSTGNELHRQPCTSGTASEYPVVVDVDADGETELLCSCGSNLINYGSSSFKWLPTRKVWNQHLFNNVNINDDLTIPRTQQEPHILTDSVNLNFFLTPYGKLRVPAPDLQVTGIELICNDGQMYLEFTVCNLGEVEFGTLLYLSIYNSNPISDKSPQLIESNQLLATIQKDSCQLFSIETGVTNVDSIYLVINDNGKLNPPYTWDDFPTTSMSECNFSNNLAFTEWPNNHLNLLEDQLSICGKDSLWIYADTILSQMLWSTGSSNPYIVVTQPGIYSLEAHDLCGLVYTDSIKVLADTVHVLIDTVLCQGDTLLIHNYLISTDTVITTFINGLNCDSIFTINSEIVSWNTPTVTPISPCPDASDGQLILDPNSLDPNESFFWEDFSNDHSRDNLSSGSYSLTVINSLGCEKTFIYSLDELNIPSPQFQVQPADCHNDFQGRLIISNANGAHSFSVHQNPLPGDSAIVLDGPAIYHLKYLFEHCPADTFFESTLIDTLQLTFDKDVVSDCGALVEINARVLNADQNAIASFELIGVDSFEQSAHDLHISFRAYHSQTVHAVVVDTHGCLYIRPISIDIDGEDHLFIPNVFTPNGDNINDEFHIYGSPCIQQINKFQIFDRWGEMVFAAYDFLPEEKGWNGQLNFEKMRPGAYTYYVVYESYAGGSFQRTGSVTILE